MFAVTLDESILVDHLFWVIRGLPEAQTEVSLAAMVYNLKCMLDVLRGRPLRALLAG